MKVIMWLSFVALVFTRVVVADDLLLLCSNGTRVEPSVRDIIESLIPTGTEGAGVPPLVRALYDRLQAEISKASEANDMPSQLFKVATYLFNEAGGLPIPLRSLVSDGVFRVDMSSNLFYFKDVFLVQKNYFVINMMCSIIPDSLYLLKAFACKCFSGTSLSSGYDQALQRQFSGSSYEWCVRNPCTDKNQRDGLCEITVDPFRTTCVVIPSISSSAQQQHHHTAPSSQKVYTHKNAVQSEQINESGDAEHVDAAVDSEDQTGRVEEEPLPPLITAESLISYNLSTPVYDAPKSIRTITETIADIFSLDMKALFPNTTNTNTGATSPEKGNKKSGGRKTSKGGNMLAADAQELLGRFGSKLGSSLEALASRTPVYLLNFVVGTFLVVQANALSGSTFFQYSLVAILGTLLALLWLLFSLYKTAENMMKTTPFTSFVAPVSILSTSVFFSMSPYLKNTVRDMTISFWKSGALGVPWLGKAYFAVSILISVVATRMLGLFGPNTSSYNVLNLTIKLIGLALLGVSTPNLEISSVLMLAALNREHIEYFMWRYYLHVAASQPTYYLTGKRLTMQQYEEEGKTETEKALQQLREYLRTHPDEMNRVCDIDECVQRGVTTKLDRFVAGNYSGLPRPEVAADDAKEVSFIMKALTFIARLVFFAGIVAALGYGLTLYYTSTYRIIA